MPLVDEKNKKVIISGFNEAVGIDLSWLVGGKILGFYFCWNKKKKA